eukprot:TRINITY_DN8240_c0_g2_i2.p1 TRINITY_DN8240_c0_g2~~TRINITY_DN8240_c0_g2_i2.p1  ORF type:complete len:160 (+),score=10.24 TRINITY_DN8240_c0_g2_i2:142-621(+)
MFVRLIVLLGFRGLAAPLATSDTVPGDVKFQIGQGNNSATGTTTCQCDHVGGAPPYNHFTCTDITKSSYCEYLERCMTTGPWIYPYDHDFSRVCTIACRCTTPGGGLHNNGYTCSDASKNAYCEANQICARSDDWAYPKNDVEWRSICPDSITVNSTIV